MSSIPTPAVNAPVRALTPQEEQRLSTDAFTQLNMRLTPARLKPESFPVLVRHARKRADYRAAQERVRDTVFVNYQEAVRVFADLLHATVMSIAYTSDELVWQVAPKGLAKRRELVREQELGLGKKDNTRFDPAEIERQNAITVAQAQADKENSAALAELRRAIDGIVFQDFRGINYPKIDAAKRELHGFAKENLKTDGSNATEVLKAVKSKIAKMHADNERSVDQWNSR